MPLVIRELVLTIRSESAPPEPEGLLDRIGDFFDGEDEEQRVREQEDAVREAVAEQLRIARQRKER